MIPDQMRGVAEIAFLFNTRNMIAPLHQYHITFSRLIRCLIERLCNMNYTCCFPALAYLGINRNLNAYMLINGKISLQVCSLFNVPI